MEQTRLEYLFSRWFHKTGTSEEKTEFISLLQRSEHEEELKELIEKVLHQHTELLNMNEEDAQSVLQAILQAGRDQTKKIIPIYRRPFFRWVAAACIVGLLGVGSYFFFFNKTNNQQPINSNRQNDVEAPKGTKAMITLANGRKVLLDSVASGTLATQGNINVVKTTSGEIIYNGTSTEIVYNILYNPRGSKVVNLTLQDETKVWLNSESSLRYPTAFTGNERKVEITGEAYFEVTHNTAKPFIVSKGETSIQVLGTHFNVNAYDDEADIKVTLLEGSIKVSNGNSNALVKPGEQAQINNSENRGIFVNSDIDIQEITAWKDNRFVFNSADIHSIMHQLSRWYNVDVVYESEIPNHFTGIISRDVNASEVFQMLQRTGTMKVRIEGKMIYIGK